MGAGGLTGQLSRNDSLLYTPYKWMIESLLDDSDGDDHPLGRKPSFKLARPRKMLECKVSGWVGWVGWVGWGGKGLWVTVCNPLVVHVWYGGWFWVAHRCVVLYGFLTPVHTLLHTHTHIVAHPYTHCCTPVHTLLHTRTHIVTHPYTHGYTPYTHTLAFFNTPLDHVTDLWCPGKQPVEFQESPIGS